MAQAEAVKFACPDCQKEYTWKPEIAGKKAKCKCGNVIDIPTTPPAPPPPPLPPPDVDPFDNPDYMYDLADEPAKGAGGRGGGAPPPPVPTQPELQTCPNCSGNIPPGGVVCLACGFNVKTGKKNKTQVVGAGGPGGKGKSSAAATAASGGAFNWAAGWKGWFWVIAGIFVIGLAPYDYSRIRAMERDPENDWTYLSRRTRRTYRAFGVWGVVGSDIIAGSLCALGGVAEIIKKGKGEE
jgi:hypothetical protein